jgi:hypothetical protein
MKPCIHLLINYCNSPRLDRTAEYDECVRRNLANPHISAVHCLKEPQTVVPEEFRTHAKYREAQIEKWMTFRDAFEYANRNLANETVCIANLDIFLDAEGTDWQKAAEFVRGPLVFCLSRVDLASDGTKREEEGLARMLFAWSQDAWVFRAPFEVPDCDFEIGTLGCDNAPAHRIKRVGRLPVNDPKRFKIFHYDQCRGKTTENQFAVQEQERAGRGQPITSYPEKRGACLLPDIHRVRSIDELLNHLKANDLQRYEIACEIVTRFLGLWNDEHNPPPSRFPYLLFPVE